MSKAEARTSAGDLALVIERCERLGQIVETTSNSALTRVEGLGDLSQCICGFSRDQRYAFVFGRDGGLSKMDMLEGRLVAR